MNHDQSRGISKPMLIMLVYCLIPLALIFAIGVFGLSLGTLRSLVPFAFALMCPLLMIFILRSMGHNHSASHTHQHYPTPQHTDQISPAQPEAKTSSQQKSCH